MTPSDEFIREQRRIFQEALAKCEKIRNEANRRRIEAGEEPVDYNTEGTLFGVKIAYYQTAEDQPGDVETAMRLMRPGVN